MGKGLEFFKDADPMVLLATLQALPYPFDIVSIYSQGFCHCAWIRQKQETKTIKKGTDK